MNETAMRAVYKTIKAAPPEEFDYSHYFSRCDRAFETKSIPSPEPGCGTAGCVAGWTAMLYFPGRNFHSANQLDDDAAEVLGIDHNTAYILFQFKSGFATREDALRRLDWLITSGGTFKDYPWELESWYARHIEDNEVFTPPPW